MGGGGGKTQKNATPKAHGDTPSKSLLPIVSCGTWQNICHVPRIWTHSLTQENKHAIYLVTRNLGEREIIVYECSFSHPSNINLTPI